MGVDVSGEVNASGATAATPASRAARAPTAGTAATTTMVKPVSTARAKGGRAASGTAALRSRATCAVADNRHSSAKTATAAAAMPMRLRGNAPEV